MRKLVEQFEDDFRAYLNASIQYAEVQKPYKPLSAKDEISWLKQWITDYAERKRAGVIHLGHDRALTWCGRPFRFLGDEAFSRGARVCRTCKKNKENNKF